MQQPGADAQPASTVPGTAGRVAAGAVAVFVLVGLALRLPADPLVAVPAAAVALVAAALLPRAGSRLAAPVAVVATVGVVVLGHGNSSNVGWFSLCVLAGWCMFAGSRGTALLFWLAALVLFGAEALWVERDPGWAAWAIGTTCTVGAAYLVRREQALVAQLRAAQAGLADRARAEERNRIARELHDVIAHSLTVSLLHLASARMAVRFDPADAERALAEAERLGRASLDEVRATVGLLKADGGADEGPAAPLPGMTGIPDLVERFRAAGAPVTLTVDGDADAVPATTGLAVYRIVQEALTNAAKHAGGAPVTVTVAVGADVGVRVDSAGRPRHGHGLGMDSMRERAESLGGTLTAGPGGRGWLVSAALPLPAARERSTR